jgi:hypothetical protein
LKEKIAKLADAKDLSPYFLFLKPFTKQQLDTQIEGHFDLEDVLRSALHPIDLISFGSEQTFIPDSKWQADFEKFAVHAKSILIIPSDDLGTEWKIKWLVENKLLPSCIWLMPETPGWSSTIVNYEVPSPKGTTEIAFSGWEVELQSPTSPSKDEEDYDIVTNWNRASKALKAVGINLPPYQPRGMFFVIDDNGTAIAFQLIALSQTFLRVRKIRLALRDLQNPNKSSNAYAPSEFRLFSFVKEFFLFWSVFIVIGALLIGNGLYQFSLGGFSWLMLISLIYGVFILIPIAILIASNFSNVLRSRSGA